jgi:Putative beta-barrel porin 2
MRSTIALAAQRRKRLKGRNRLRSGSRDVKGTGPMIGRLVWLVGAWTIVLVAALGQAQVTPDSSRAPTTPDRTTAPAPSEETQPISPTRTLESEIDADEQPLVPMTPRPEPETTVQPEEPPVEPETVGTQEAIDIDELGRRRWRIIPLFTIGFEYNDNIFISETDRVSDFLWVATGGFIFELGDFRNRTENYLGVKWLGQPVIYTENSEQNAFNQFAAISLQYRFTKMVVRWDSNYSYVKGPNREVNEITTTQQFWNSLIFAYDYSEKTQLNFTLYQSTTLTEGFQDNNQYEARAGIDYQIFPKTRLGGEGAIGILDSTDTPLQYYQQLRLRIAYLPTEKLTFTFNGGIQFIEFEGTDEVKVEPVFSLGVAYQPFPATSIALMGFRNIVGSSLEPGQDYAATGFELSVQQRFFQKVVAAVNFGYENDSYFGTTPGTETQRVDDYVYVRPRLTYAFVDWFSASIFYEYRQTASTLPGFSFYNNRAGLEFLTKF